MTNYDILIILHGISLVIFSIVLFVMIDTFRKKIYDIMLYNETSRNELVSLYDQLNEKINDINIKIRETSSIVNTLDQKVLNLEKKLIETRSIKIKPIQKMKKTESVSKTEETKMLPTTLTPTQKMIIEKLKEGPMTYKEIQRETKLSREHISRELKKLYDLGIVDRDESSKPYTYTLKVKTT